MIAFIPAPIAADIPSRFPSPFDRAAVPAIARRAVDEMRAFLTSRAGERLGFDRPGGGKMLGVLVVEAPDGTIGYLRAFSGMLHGAWDVEGWAPPAFDAAAWDAERFDGRANDHEDDPHVRATRSRELLPLVQAAYRFTNARGEVRSLRDLFAPAEPPGGAGDCAGPKLLAQAYRLGLRPLALAEFWWGAPPRSGDRHAGAFYAACRGKCAPILAHMLDGLPADPMPVFGASPFDDSQPVIVYEDAELIIVDKP
ncbi:MAG: RluA family pseudouridine synthase, partial [Gemmatimonadetes bacterium]|nr:RluA family pseudouridine synthase [Gemmatimonadota bacterium]